MTATARPGDQRAMLMLVRLTAWTLVALLVAVTLAPIGFRPVLLDSPNRERAVAYAVLGFLLALSYPRRWWLALAAGVAVAGVLEAAQGLTESRHGRAFDFAVKGAGATLGALSAQAGLILLERWPAGWRPAFARGDRRNGD